MRDVPKRRLIDLSMLCQQMCAFMAKVARVDKLCRMLGKVPFNVISYSSLCSVSSWKCYATELDYVVAQSSKAKQIGNDNDEFATMLMLPQLHDFKKVHLNCDRCNLSHKYKIKIIWNSRQALNWGFLTKITVSHCFTVMLVQPSSSNAVFRNSVIFDLCYKVGKNMGASMKRSVVSNPANVTDMRNNLSIQDVLNFTSNGMSYNLI